MPSSFDTPSARRAQLIDAWLSQGGIVVASSERVARSIRGTYNRRRQAEGLTAWAAPAIHEWRAFVRNEWEARFADGRMVLSGLQEEWLFGRIAETLSTTATILHGPRLRLAAMAREAHALLCAYAPECLENHERAAWPGDSEIFSAWLTAFSKRCDDDGLLSAARLPLELVAKLNPEEDRDPLLLVGFDRLTPTQTRLFAAWGEHECLNNGPTLATTHFFETSDATSELAACALWCRERLATDPTARLLIISQDADLRRGEIERAFTHHLQPMSGVPPLEFSLGVSLSRVPLVQGALLLLRWLTGKPLAENEVDWLLASGLTTEDNTETGRLQRQMKNLRRRQMQRPEWTLEAFLNSGSGLPETWTRRMMNASRRLQPLHTRRTPTEWAELLHQTMQDAGWPGSHPMPSANHQVYDQWQQTVEEVGTLGFDRRPLPWNVFHSSLARQVEDTLFAPESESANILISAPAQSAGLVADAIWFLGAEEDAWPFAGQSHPFLPLFLQRQCNMPHASAQADMALSRTITDRLLHAAPVVCFSAARVRGTAEAKPSSLIVSIVGHPVDPPSNLVDGALPQPQTIAYEDRISVPFIGTKADGGVHTLTMQSQCAFRAFATARLGAQHWDAAEVGLTPAQRGDLVHSVLRSVWGGTDTEGLSGSVELQAVLANGGNEGLRAFVQVHVSKVMQALPTSLCERLPVRYLALEEQRLLRLVTEWLLFESRRASFKVAATEKKTPVVVAGLTLELRLDRRDVLEDGSTIIVDYKTGEASPNQWESNRPENVQLPLYAVYGVEAVERQDPAGLVFASVRPGNAAFAGRVRDVATFLPEIGSRHALATKPLTDQQLLDWRAVIDDLATEFLKGQASVLPRDFPSTCEHCSLSALCRVAENRLADV